MYTSYLSRCMSCLRAPFLVSFLPLLSDIFLHQLNIYFVDLLSHTAALVVQESWLFALYQRLQCLVVAGLLGSPSVVRRFFFDRSSGIFCCFEPSSWCSLSFSFVTSCSSSTTIIKVEQVLQLKGVGEAVIGCAAASSSFRMGLSSGCLSEFSGAPLDFLTLVRLKVQTWSSTYPSYSFPLLSSRLGSLSPSSQGFVAAPAPAASGLSFLVPRPRYLVRF